MISKKKIISFSSLFFTLLIIYSASAQAQSDEFSPFIESFPNGKIDWESGYIYGVGIGYPHLNEGSRARALKVAQASALSAILQVASRLRVNDQNNLSDLETKKIIIQIRGLIQYEPHERKFVREGDQPSYRVTYRAPMKGVKGLTKNLLTHLRSRPLMWRDFPQQGGLENGDESYPWLVLDARGLQQKGPAQPALFPKIISERGETIYDLTMAAESALVKRGMARYVVSDKVQTELRTMFDKGPIHRLTDLFSPQLAFAQEKKKRKRRGKYIIKNVKKAQGLKRTNLVISESDAKNIREEDASSQILKKCRVIVIVSSSIGGIEGKFLPHFALGQ